MQNSFAIMQNNFALMRILRKEGLDAHLFLYTNEQFFPSEDSDNLSNWENFIHDLKISNGKPDILFFNKKKLAHIQAKEDANAKDFEIYKTLKIWRIY